MIGHELGPHERETDDEGRDHYTAVCGCGLDIYGRLSLLRLYDAHQMHLNAVRAMSRNNHPTRWENKP